MHQWVLCYSSGFKEWNHGWKIRASHGWHHHPRPHQHHHFFTHHPHCYTHFCRYSFPHYSMMIIMIVIWGENWSLQVLFLSLTTLLTSSIATSPRVSSPTINRFSKYDPRLTSRSARSPVGFWSITSSSPSLSLPLGSSSPTGEYFHSVVSILILVRRRYRGGSVREPLITFERFYIIK